VACSPPGTPRLSSDLPDRLALLPARTATILKW
jgi:hypothetical protein